MSTLVYLYIISIRIVDLVVCNTQKLRRCGVLYLQLLPGCDVTQLPKRTIHSKVLLFQKIRAHSNHVEFLCVKKQYHLFFAKTSQVTLISHAFSKILIERDFSLVGQLKENRVFSLMYYFALQVNFYFSWLLSNIGTRSFPKLVWIRQGHVLRGQIIVKPNSYRTNSAT